MAFEKSYFSGDQFVSKQVFCIGNKIHEVLIKFLKVLMIEVNAKINILLLIIIKFSFKNTKGKRINIFNNKVNLLNIEIINDKIRMRLYLITIFKLYYIEK